MRVWAKVYDILKTPSYFPPNSLISACSGFEPFYTGFRRRDWTKFEMSEVSCLLRQHSISYPIFAPSVPLGSSLRKVAFNYAQKSQVTTNLLFKKLLLNICRWQVKLPPPKPQCPEQSGLAAFPSAIGGGLPGSAPGRSTAERHLPAPLRHLWQPRTALFRT